MAKTTCQNKNFSTTRLLIKEKPIIEYKSKGNFETDLFLPKDEKRKSEGGLRTKGYFKKSYNNKSLISIITVVFNGAKELEQTIQSVINQTYNNVEYIIIDGGSHDGTLDIIKKYKDQIDYWVSEKDNGIYDAMNKGIDLASGEWINFMNAGDVFYDENVLEKIHVELKNEFTVVSGQVSIYYENEFIENYGSMKIIPHQAAFFKSLYMKTLKFDLEYKILADGELLRRLQQLKEYNAKYMDIIVAKFYLGGVGNNPKILFRRIKEELKMKSESNQSVSFKWTLFQIYNFVGLLFYKIFGEYRYYTIFQKKTLSILKNLNKD